MSKISAGDNYVRALGASSDRLGSWTKGGMNKWFFRPSAPCDITTFSNASHSHFLAAATTNLELLFLNSMTGSVVRQVPTTSVITQLQFSHSVLLSGSSDGFLRVHDPRTGMGRAGAAESVIKSHTGSIQGLQTIGNFAFTIGMGERQSRPFPDPLVKVYDLRTMRPLPPIAFSSGPAFIQVLPKRVSSIVVVSNQGLVNVVDVSNFSSPSEFHQLDISSHLTSFSVSPTGTYMAFGDAEGVIHLISQAEDSVTPFSGFEGQPIPWVDTPAPLPNIEWEASTPLNSIGLPYYDTQLLSSWSSQFATTIGDFPSPTKIPPQVLNTMKTKDNIAYAALPKELRGRRNVISVGPSRGNGRFRSGRSKPTEPEPESVAYDMTYGDVPRIYRRVEIEYSKFGVEDFDFGFYNKTDCSGLETHILNSYTNAIVQLMHYVQPIRLLAKSHITTNCPREHCLLCELGFVSRMLEDAHGTNCQSSNFCKTVGVLAQASNAIEIVDYGRETTDVDYAHKIQTFHRFLIDHLSSEGNAFPHNPQLWRRTSDSQSLAAAPITQLVGIDAKNMITCSNCKALREKENMTHVVDLTYPRKVWPPEEWH